MDIFDKAFNWTAADEVRAAGVYPYFRPNTAALGTEVTIGGKKMIMIGSNNYLGLVTHPEVLEAMIAATRKYGSACTGSPFLNGTIDIRMELEEKLAKFVGMESALVFSTGYMSNLGALSTIATRGDYIFSDRENHASIFDGCRPRTRTSEPQRRPHHPRNGWGIFDGRGRLQAPQNGRAQEEVRLPPHGR
jgi:7-keto-8-aminopelargonate synthetase-like enzyme